MRPSGLERRTRLCVAMAFAMCFGRSAHAQRPPELQPPLQNTAEEPPTSDASDTEPKVESFMPMNWWANRVSQQVLSRDKWVAFDLETLLLDTLENSPRIQSVAHRTSATVHRIVQQDAAFDPTILLGGDLGATNDPVGNTLTTGGAERLREKSLNLRGGARRTTRSGTEVEWQQEFGFLDSNSTFFIPREQGNSRLSINLTKPLLSRGGRYYNERLVTQARIENRVTWHEMRVDVEQRIADVIAAYWTLYQLRVQVTQQKDLLLRGQQIERLLSSRQNFDASRIEIIRARSRVATRADRLLDLQTDLEKQQVRLSVLVGSQSLLGAGTELELIPTVSPNISETQWNLRDAVAQALENRPEIQAATHDLELSALEMRITRAELEPQLNWVFNGYLSQLNGSSKIADSFWEQFENAPGVSSGLEFELPRGRRAAKARQREAIATYKQRSENLREAIQQTQFEVESALIDLRNFGKQRVLKRTRLTRAIEQENLITVKWRLVGGDGSKVGVVLESVLDAQQRRTEAEQDLVANESAYMLAQVALQRAMGTLLINEGIRSIQSDCQADITFVRDGVHAEIVDEIEPSVDAIPLELEEIDSRQQAFDFGDQEEALREPTPEDYRMPHADEGLDAQRLNEKAASDQNATLREPAPVKESEDDQKSASDMLQISAKLNRQTRPLAPDESIKNQPPADRSLLTRGHNVPKNSGAIQNLIDIADALETIPSKTHQQLTTRRKNPIAQALQVTKYPTAPEFQPPNNGPRMRRLPSPSVQRPVTTMPNAIQQFVLPMHPDERSEQAIIRSRQRDVDSSIRPVSDGGTQTHTGGLAR